MVGQSNERRVAERTLTPLSTFKDESPYRGRTLVVCEIFDKLFEIHKIDCKCKGTKTY
jgi:hypothetical protein